MNSEVALREEMVAAGQLLWQRNLLGATEGNLSCRLSSEGTLLCTPTGVSKGHLKADDLVIIDLEGNVLDGSGSRPSSEIKLHLRLYKCRPEILAVVHAHPVTATAFATCGETVPHDYLPEAVVVLGAVALVPFAMPGTEEVPDAIEPFALAAHKAFLLANHGAVTVGHSLMDAAYRMETLERVAQIVYKARQIGRPWELAEDDLTRLVALAESYE